MTSISLGFTRIAEMLGIALVQPPFSRSHLGSTNRTERHPTAEIRS